MRISLIPVLVFSFAVSAQQQKQQPNVCDPNSPLLNQALNEDGLKTELKNLGEQVASDIGSDLYFNLRRQQGGEPTCTDVVNAIRSAQGDPYAPGATKDNQAVYLTGFNCEAGTFSFNVPGFLQGKHLMTTPHDMNDPVRPQDSKRINEMRNGQIITGKSLVVKAKTDLRQLRIANDGRAFRYDNNGRITDVISYERQSSGRFKLKCEKVGRYSDERIWQMDHTIPVMKAFAQKGVCKSKCLPQVQAIVDENLKAVSAAQRSNIAANKVSRDPNDRCGILEDRMASDRCLNDADAKSARTCASSATTRMIACNQMNCRQMANVFGGKNCFSNAMASEFNKLKCSLPNNAVVSVCVSGPGNTEKAEVGR